jgi:(p)ppGpp synthase/HD superfamily hydrolase
MAQALEGVIGTYEGVLPARNPGPPAPPPLDPGHTLGPRVAQAVAFAIEKHGDQVRKGTSTSYLTHLLAVASLVGESGGSEDEVIAGLLHDAVEDGGGAPVLAEIEAAFGAEVAAIVKSCTDDESVGEKAPWLERKRAYMAHLIGASIPALRVVCADKLHNVQAISKDLRLHGAGVFERFRGDREGTLWYYRSIARLFGALIQDEPDLDTGLRAMIRELRESVGRMES